MSNLIGEYVCKLDSKGRLLVPSDLMQQLPGVKDDGLIALCGFEKQLTIYPMGEWNKKVKKLSKLSEYDEKSRTFLRLLTRGATPLKLDGAGRVLFPKQLLEYASISNEMTLTCLLSRIEAWDTTTYNKALNDTPINMADLAQQLSHIIDGGDDE